MSFPARSNTLDPVAAYEQRLAVVPITRDHVRAAVALIPRQQRTGLGMPFGFVETNQSSRLYERERWYLSVSPGTVRVHSRLMAPKATIWEDEGVTITEEAPVRGAVSDFSTRSRAMMFQTLPSLDYEPMFASGGHAAMVTLTLPGEGWEKLVPDLGTFKKMINRFQQQYKRAWGSSPVAVWKMEFQHRGAPHVHLFMVPPTGYARGRGAKREFTNWASITWAKIVGAAVGTEARIWHELRGVDVSWKEGARFSDPRRIAAYFSKHGAFADKEYQNHMPEHWRQAILEGNSGGARFWGYWQLEKAVETIELKTERPSTHAAPFGYCEDSQWATDTITGTISPIMSRDVRSPESGSSDVVIVMRHLRKLARSRSFVKQVTVERWSVDGQTGVVKVRRRKVRRRAVYLKGQRSGFLVVNDGPSTARDIARLLGIPTRQMDYELVS